MERLSDASHVNEFITGFKTQRAAPAKASRDALTPSDRPLEQPLSEEDHRVAEIRQQISERFREGIGKGSVR